MMRFNCSRKYNQKRDAVSNCCVVHIPNNTKYAFAIYHIFTQITCVCICPVLPIATVEERQSGLHKKVRTAVVNSVKSSRHHCWRNVNFQEQALVLRVLSPLLLLLFFTMALPQWTLSCCEDALKCRIRITYTQEQSFCYYIMLVQVRYF